MQVQHCIVAAVGLGQPNPHRARSGQPVCDRVCTMLYHVAYVVPCRAIYHVYHVVRANRGKGTHGRDRVVPPPVFFCTPGATRSETTATQSRRGPEAKQHPGFEGRVEAR